MEEPLRGRSRVRIGAA